MPGSSITAAPSRAKISAASQHHHQQRADGQLRQEGQRGFLHLGQGLQQRHREAHDEHRQQRRPHDLQRHPEGFAYCLTQRFLDHPGLLHAPSRFGR
jgi:hypothetical protein